jgi:hypothetical protein
LGIFEIGSQELFCPGWLWTVILLSSKDYRCEPLAQGHADSLFISVVLIVKF